MPPQLEKNHVVPTAWQDEALARDGVSREVPCSALKGVSDSVRPHSRQPTRLPCPWDSPGKNTGVGCHFLLQCMKVKLKSLSRVLLLATSWTAAHQGPPSMGFSRQEYWSWNLLALVWCLVSVLVWRRLMSSCQLMQLFGSFPSYNQPSALLPPLSLLNLSGVLSSGFGAFRLFQSIYLHLPDFLSSCFLIVNVSKGLITSSFWGFPPTLTDFLFMSL